MDPITLGTMAAVGGAGAWSAGRQADAKAEAIEEANRIAKENLRRQKQYRQEALNIIQDPTQQEQDYHSAIDKAVQRIEGSNMVPQMQEARSMLHDTAAGDYLMAEDNPYMQSHIEAAQRPVTENYLENVLPSLESQAIQAGAYGGSRAGLAQAQASEDYQQQLADISTQMASQNYQRERQNQLQAQQNLPSMMQSEIQVMQMPAQLQGQSAEMAAQRDRTHAQLAGQLQPQRQITDQYKPPEDAAMLQGGIQGAVTGASLGMELSDHFAQQSAMEMMQQGGGGGAQGGGAFPGGQQADSGIQYQDELGRWEPSRVRGVTSEFDQVYQNNMPSGGGGSAQTASGGWPGSGGGMDLPSLSGGTKKKKTSSGRDDLFAVPKGGSADTWKPDLPSTGRTGLA